jgi:hypothetical protein
LGQQGETLVTYRISECRPAFSLWDAVSFGLFFFRRGKALNLKFNNACVIEVRNDERVT